MNFKSKYLSIAKMYILCWITLNNKKNSKLAKNNFKLLIFHDDFAKIEEIKISTTCVFSWKLADLVFSNIFFITFSNVLNGKFNFVYFFSLTFYFLLCDEWPRVSLFLDLQFYYTHSFQILIKECMFKNC